MFLKYHSLTVTKIPIVTTLQQQELSYLLYPRFIYILKCWHSIIFSRCAFFIYQVMSTFLSLELWNIPQYKVWTHSRVNLSHIYGFYIYYWSFFILFIFFYYLAFFLHFFCLFKFYFLKWIFTIGILKYYNWIIPFPLLLSLLLVTYAC